MYIREAHASDVWQIPSNLADGIVFASPKTSDVRQGIGRMCMTRLAIAFPGVMDTMEDQTERAYTAWPDRLYVIDRDGRVAFKSDPGPFGFRTNGVAETLKQLIPDITP